MLYKYLSDLEMLLDDRKETLYVKYCYKMTFGQQKAKYN